MCDLAVDPSATNQGLGHSVLPGSTSTRSSGIDNNWFWNAMHTYSASLHRRVDGCESGGAELISTVYLVLMGLPQALLVNTLFGVATLHRSRPSIGKVGRLRAFQKIYVCIVTKGNNISVYWLPLTVVESNLLTDRAFRHSNEPVNQPFWLQSPTTVSK